MASLNYNVLYLAVNAGRRAVSKNWGFVQLAFRINAESLKVEQSALNSLRYIVSNCCGTEISVSLKLATIDQFWYIYPIGMGVPRKERATKGGFQDACKDLELSPWLETISRPSKYLRE